MRKPQNGQKSGRSDLEVSKHQVPRGVNPYRDSILRAVLSELRSLESDNSKLPQANRRICKGIQTGTSGEMPSTQRRQQ